MRSVPYISILCHTVLYWPCCTVLYCVCPSARTYLSKNIVQGYGPVSVHATEYMNNHVPVHMWTHVCVLICSHMYLCVLDLFSVSNHSNLLLLCFAGCGRPLWTSRSSVSWRAGYLFWHIFGKNTPGHSRRGKRCAGSRRPLLINESLTILMPMLVQRRPCWSREASETTDQHQREQKWEGKRWGERKAKSKGERS